MSSYKIKSEDDLLNQDVRAKIIEGFQSQKNICRKDEAFKAYECLKDKTVNYVLELLLKQFDLTTVQEMQYALSNISILRKVIDKLARVYNNGVKRTVPDSAIDTASVEQAAEYLSMNTTMKKANKYYRTFKNTLAYVRPRKAGELYDIAVEILPPFKYDAVENPDNPELPLAIVLSDYKPRRKTLYAIGDAALAGRSNVRIVNEVDTVLLQSYTPSTGIVGAGDSSECHEEYIWWTEHYHFTTNVKGQIISYEQSDTESGFENPIGMLPFVNLVAEQDGCFWAEGGQDLVDTSISVNVDLTNIKHIGNSQGYGQLYMTGKDLPKSVKVGPNHCVQLEQNDKDEPAPTIGYLNSNPPLADLKSIIEMEVALMLSTNNLSTSGFATSLQGGKDFASGIAMLIDKSESIEDINEQAQMFIDKEPEIWERFYAWLEVYKSSGELTDEAQVLKPVKNPEEIDIAFPSPKLVMSESDQLDVLQKRKDLGLNTTVELLMRDDPSLTEETAQLKLDKIKAEKMANAASMGLPVPNAANGDLNGNQSQEGGGVSGQNGLDDQPSGGPQNTGSNEDAD